MKIILNKEIQKNFSIKYIFENKLKNDELMSINNSINKIITNGNERIII